ncbi:MAG: hypothetical protein M3256_01665 [Actinomycetota bacterium]|nr:hypothetical protein [Actinomycetota bacterium]
MESYPQHDETNEPTVRGRGPLIAVAVVVTVVLLMIVLHLTGVMGP